MSSERSISLHARTSTIPPANLSHGLAVVLLGLLTAVAAMVLARRLAGALTHPLDPAMLLVVGVLVAAAAAVARLGWRLPSSDSLTPRQDWAVMVLTSAAVAALGGGLCLPDTPVLGKFLLCTLLVAEESWAWARCARLSHSLPAPAPPSSVPISHPPLLLDQDTADMPEDVVQRLTRSRAADGTEALSGWLRTAFAPGQRTGSIHVAFCPPFVATPELEVEQIDGPEARIKTAQLLPYGVRLDLKLEAVCEEPAAVLLQFSARTMRGHR